MGTASQQMSCKNEPEDPGDGRGLALGRGGIDSLSVFYPKNL